MMVMLHELGWKPEWAGVATFDEASRLVTRWQDERGMGASDMGERHGECFDGTEQIARISYNGRVWMV